MALLQESGHEVASGTTRTLLYATMNSHVNSKDNKFPSHIFRFYFSRTEREREGGGGLKRQRPN